MEKSSGQGNRKWRLNFFDVIFIICVLIIAVVVILYSSRSDGGSGIVFSGTRGTVVYRVELKGLIEDTAYLIKPGDSLVDKVEKRPMGTVVSVEVNPSTASNKSYITGERIITDVPDRKDAVLLVTSEATITENQISVPGGFVVRVGTWVSVNGPLYNCAGYIIDMERDDAA